MKMKTKGLKLMMLSAILFFSMEPLAFGSAVTMEDMMNRLENLSTIIQEQQKEVKRNPEHNRDIAANDGSPTSEGVEHGGQAEDQGNIADIAPDHIPHRDHALALNPGDQADNQFGRGGPERNDRKADDDRPDSQTPCQFRRSLDEPFRPIIEHDQADNEKQNEN